jgi:hypothetical protein
MFMRWVLANRRALIIERREFIIKRARTRFQSHIAKDGGVPPYLTLAACPTFPDKELVPRARAKDLLTSSIIPWRSGTFPYSVEAITQHESMVVVRPSGLDRSFLELNTWGLLFYGHNIYFDQSQQVNSSTAPRGIHLYSLIGHILVYLEHFRSIFQKIGFEGSLLIRVRLDKIRGISLLYSDGWNGLSANPASPLDDDFEFEMLTDSCRLLGDRDGLTVELIKVLLYALNQHDTAINDQSIMKLIAAGYWFNSWSAQSA